MPKWEVDPLGDIKKNLTAFLFEQKWEHVVCLKKNHKQETTFRTRVSSKGHGDRYQISQGLLTEVYARPHMLQQ